MRTTNRNYTDEQGDFGTVTDFLIHHAGYLHASATWDLARFIDWKYGLYDHRIAVARFWQKNAQLWFDGFGKLAGMAICENGGAEFAIVTAPGYRFLYGEMLHWVMTSWKHDGNHYETEVLAPQTLETGVLKRHGFVEGETLYAHCFVLTKELPSKLPMSEEFVIIDMESHPEYAQQRGMRSAALDGRDDLSDKQLQFQLEFYNNTHNAPTYHPYTDLVVKAKDGTHVAGCEALIDPWNCTAAIERVCTREEFRRKGLARAAIQECLYRLQNMGMKRAYITGYSKAAISLYNSLGADEVIEGHRFSKTGDDDVFDAKNQM